MEASPGLGGEVGQKWAIQKGERTLDDEENV